MKQSKNNQVNRLIKIKISKLKTELEMLDQIKIYNVDKYQRIIPPTLKNINSS